MNKINDKNHNYNEIKQPNVISTKEAHVDTLLEAGMASSTALICGSKFMSIMVSASAPRL
jgi:hypothetical protein